MADEMAQVGNPNSVDRLNLRKAKSTQSISLGKYYNGCIVSVLSGESDGWCKVCIGNRTGYMRSEYLRFGGEIDQSCSELPEVTVRNSNGKGANLRVSPLSDARIQQYCPNGTDVQVLGISEDWCHVQVGYDVGFMQTRYLNPQLSYKMTDAVIPHKHTTIAPSHGEWIEQNIRFAPGKTYPVYSGPGKMYLRGANGKASVSTNDWIQVFGKENGWILIQYAISQDCMRMGWIPENTLPKSADVAELSFTFQPATLLEKTVVTDDPLL